MDLIAAFGKMKVSDKPAGVSPEVAKRMSWLPKHFIKPTPEKSETSATKPIIALSNVLILDLAQASAKHQQVLDDLLRKIKVKPSITPEDMAQIVNQAMTNALITFSDEDLPKPHVFHNNALYVVIRARGMIVPHVLIDGGSSLNICPEMTAKALGIKEEEYIPDPITIYGSIIMAKQRKEKSSWRFSLTIQSTLSFFTWSMCRQPIIYFLDDLGSITRTLCRLLCISVSSGQKVE